MTELKINKKVEEESEGIDFSSIEKEVVQEKEKIKIKKKEEEKEKNSFKFDKKVWAIAGIIAAIIVISAVVFAYVI